MLAAKRQRLDLAEARLAPARAAGASRHRARLQLLLDRLARRSPDVALANARARLARIDHRPLQALRNDVQRRGEALAQLGRRLVVARDASLERARALQGRRTDRLIALSDRLAQAGARGVERRRDRLEGLAGLLAGGFGNFTRGFRLFQKACAFRFGIFAVGDVAYYRNESYAFVVLSQKIIGNFHETECTVSTLDFTFNS